MGSGSHQRATRSWTRLGRVGQLGLVVAMSAASAAETATETPEAPAAPGASPGSPAWAPAGAAIEPPRLKVGDAATYLARVLPGDTCTEGVDAEARVTVTVTEVSDAGVKFLQKGYPRAADTRTLARALDLSYPSKGAFKTYRTDLHGFPMLPGKTWQTTLVFGPRGTGQTDLQCQHQPMTRLTVAAGDFEVIPIVCTGQWVLPGQLNQTYSGPATFRQWYAPQLGVFVKWTVQTSRNAASCTDTSWELQSVAAAP